ncbi:MAG TPA: PilZ domain-containing protein [Beijerinckiaceae bacterium]|nr:PilZ domain-containing protein [Rhodoblastus sp.]HRY02351.1 PilZ domain-containing protein [Beijerinckiaceae bacterium]
MEQERRFGKRESVRMRARLRTPAGRSYDVLVQDISDGGCRIEKPEYEMAPERFTLRFSDGRPDRQAEVVWQKGNLIGAEFADVAATAMPVHRMSPEVHKMSLGDLRRIAGRA